MVTLDNFAFFLKRYNTLERFKDNLEWFNTVGIEDYFNGEPDKRKLIVNAFSWASSPSGMTYWSDISSKWQKFIKDELEETV